MSTSLYSAFGSSSNEAGNKNEKNNTLEEWNHASYHFKEKRKRYAEKHVVCIGNHIAYRNSENKIL
ncbi:MAG TPA: hypothetical protein VH500_09490 [Nitrososphaeraceae archaeon]|jgi:hypothetical protein